MANIYNSREAETSPVTRPKRPKVLESIQMKRSANGGFIASHRFDNSGPGSGYHDSEEHTFGAGQGQDLMAHVAQHLGIKQVGKPKVEKPELPE